MNYGHRVSETPESYFVATFLHGDHFNLLPGVRVGFICYSTVLVLKSPDTTIVRPSASWQANLFLKFADTFVRREIANKNGNSAHLNQPNSLPLPYFWIRNFPCSAIRWQPYRGNQNRNIWQLYHNDNSRVLYCW